MSFETLKKRSEGDCSVNYAARGTHGLSGLPRGISIAPLLCRYGVLQLIVDVLETDAGVPSPTSRRRLAVH